jgi:hypothetical protein
MSRGALTPRVLLLTLLLLPVNALWLTETEFVRYSDNVTTQALFFNAISLLLVLRLLNGALRLLRPAWIFTTAELTALYGIVVAGSALAGHDTLQILFTTLTYPIRHAVADPAWGTEILASLPPHLVVRDTEAIGALYSGNSTLYRADHLRPWLVPLGWWSVFVLVLVWTMLCLTALFRKPWEDERLSYPIAELPLQLVRDDSGLLRAPLLWLGALLGGSLQLINLIHVLFPSFPGAPVGVTNYQSALFPWNAAGPIPICTYAFAYGLTFLLPTQLGFSCWFFFLLSRVELVGAALYGYTEWGKFPYIQQQGIGAIAGFFLAIVWAARGHLWRVLDAATGGAAMDDRDEPLPARVAAYGLLLGFLALVAFGVGAGMRWQTALLFFGILLVIVVVVARLRAELGLPTFELYQVGGDQILPSVAGGNAWSRSDYTAMTLFFFLTRTHRQFPMQSQVDTMQLGRRAPASLRSLSAALLLASALGIVCAFWAFLHTTYQVGFESARFQGPALWAFGVDPWRKWGNWVHSPLPPDGGNIGAYGFGAGVTLLLALLRMRFAGWPFHPAGYLVSGSFGLFRLWLPIFVSWLVKALLLRYGGLRAYRRALPFAYGLILGEFAMGFVRSLLDLGFHLDLPAGSGIGGL